MKPGDNSHNNINARYKQKQSGIFYLALVFVGPTRLRTSQLHQDNK